MVVLDVTIMNVALPAEGGAAHVGVGPAWVMNAYTLTFAGFLLLGGRAADLWGRRRVFLVGLAIFWVFSLLGGLAQTGGELIAARAAQGIGGAILAPASLTLLTATFTDTAGAVGRSVCGARGQRRRGRTAAGGVLTDLLVWRWILFINVPVGIALIAGADPVAEGIDRNAGQPSPP